MAVFFFPSGKCDEQKRLEQWTSSFKRPQISLDFLIEENYLPQVKQKENFVHDPKRPKGTHVHQTSPTENTVNNNSD